MIEHWQEGRTHFYRLALDEGPPAFQGMPGGPSSSDPHTDAPAGIGEQLALQVVA